MKQAVHSQESEPNFPPGRFSGLAMTFLKSVLLLIPLHAAVSCILLTLAAYAYVYTLTDSGAWSLIGGWSLTALYGVVGIIAGILTGFSAAATRTAEAFEKELSAWLRQGATKPDQDSLPSVPLQQLRSQYETTLDQYLTNTMSRFGLPGFLDRFIRSKLREAIVHDFVDDCQQRGLTTAGSQEFRTWLKVKGVALVMFPIYDQFQWWRFLVYGVLGLLGGLALTLSYFNL